VGASVPPVAAQRLSRLSAAHFSQSSRASSSRPILERPGRSPCLAISQSSARVLVESPPVALAPGYGRSLLTQRGPGLLRHVRDRPLRCGRLLRFGDVPPCCHGLLSCRHRCLPIPPLTWLVNCQHSQGSNQQRVADGEVTTVRSAAPPSFTSAALPVAYLRRIGLECARLRGGSEIRKPGRHAASTLVQAEGPSRDRSEQRPHARALRLRGVCGDCPVSVRGGRRAGRIVAPRSVRHARCCVQRTVHVTSAIVVLYL
jgi:hypothetical protein